MHVVVIGAAGMIGRKLSADLARLGELGGREISQLTLCDLDEPLAPLAESISVQTLSGDLTDPRLAQRLVALEPDVIFHLAAIVSGAAELDFESGYATNLDGTRHLLEALRLAKRSVKFVFTSSIAVFGAPFPTEIPDDFHLTPHTSYGTQKAICELLLSDYSRKGYVDGVALRLPTICVRPGKPNAAASGFFSSIIREPLNGQPAILPVSDDVMHWHASPRAAVRFLLHAAQLEGQQLGSNRAITLPGVAATVGEQIAALERVAGKQVTALIQRQPDPFIEQIVANWPRSFEATRAAQLGFQAEGSFEEIIQVYIEDDLHSSAMLPV